MSDDRPKSIPPEELARDDRTRHRLARVATITAGEMPLALGVAGQLLSGAGRHATNAAAAEKAGDANAYKRAMRSLEHERGLLVLALGVVDEALSREVKR